MTNLLIHLSFLLVFYGLVKADEQYTYKGCYSASSIKSLDVSSKGEYMYQTDSYCRGQCNGSEFFALYDGGYCFCGNSLEGLDKLTMSSKSNCNVHCNGWEPLSCGGSSYMDVYVNENAADSASSSHPTSSSTTSDSSQLTASTTENTSSTSSLSSTSTTRSSSSPSSSSSHTLTPSLMSSATSTSSTPFTTSSTSTSSSMFTTTSASSTVQPVTSIIAITSTTSSTSTLLPTNVASASSLYSQPSSTDSSKKASYSSIMTSLQYTTHIVTASVITAENQEPKTIYLTTTSLVQTVTPSLSSLNSKYNKNKKSSSLSGGSIAGIVIGVVFGTLIIAVLAFLYFMSRHQKNKTPDLEETKQYQPYSFGDQDANPVIIPPSSTTSNWRRPSRNNTAMTADTTSKSAFTLPKIKSNTSVHSNYNPVTSTINKRNGSVGTHSNNSSDTQSNMNGHNRNSFENRRSNLPSTVFEEPPSFYEGNQRFSTSSLPDMMDQRQLRIVNPEDDSDQYDSPDVSRSLESIDEKYISQS